MRPKVLEFSAFGSYPNNELIDFEKINDLFLITGNTGAGKTTILDALTYALYGDTSGGDRPADSIRCEKAKDKVKTKVKLTFEHDGHTYVVERTFEPQFTTPDSKNKAFLYCDDKQIGNKRTMVNEAIKDLIKLDLSKWRMIVTIPQGKFSELIKADEDKQKEIIKNIFNTVQYGEYTAEIGKRREASVKAVSDSIAGIKNTLSNIKYDEGTDLQVKISECMSAKESVVIDKIKEAMESLSVQNENDKETIRGSENVLSKLKEEYLAADNALKDANDILKRYEKMDSLNKRLDSLNSKIDSFEQEKKNNERSKSALYNVKPKEDLLNKEISALSAIEKNIIAKNEKICDLNDRLSKSKEDLDAAEKKKKENAEEEYRYAVVKDQLGDYEDLSSKMNERDKINNDLDKLKTEVESLKKDELSLNDEKNKIELFIDSNDIADELTSVKMEVERSNGLVRAVKKIRDELIKLKAAEDDLVEKGNDLSSSLQESKTAKEECERVESLYFGNYEALIAKKLIDGAACPVCGSLVHPHPAELKSESATEEEWNNAKKERDAKEKAANDIKHRYESIKETVRTSKVFIISELEENNIGFEIGEGYPESFNKIVEEKTDENKSLKTKLKNLEKIEVELSTGKEKLNKINEEIVVLNNNLNNAGSVIGEFSMDLSTVNGQIELLLNKLDYPSKEKAEEELESMKTHIESVDNHLKDCKDKYDSLNQELETTKSSLQEESDRKEAAEKTVLDAERCFNDVLEENGFSSKEDYRSFLKKDEEIKKADESIRKFFDEFNGVKALVEDQKKEIKDTPRPSNIKELKEVLKEAEKRKDDAFSRDQMIKYRSDHNVSVEEKLIDAMKKHTVLDKKSERLKTLWDVANGSYKSISFDVFVQEKYFRTIVAEANRIFIDMSQRRYRMITKIDAPNSDKKDILNLNVEDLKNETIRDIRSLSGGETFLAALSLALGFSTTIQELAGGNTVDALFIDEGFGTLDDDHLSSTAKMLLDYASGGGELKKRKCIGLITHRKELEMYIQKKLHVVYEPEEGSRILQYI